MKFALSTVACPQLEPAALAEQARQWEYQGVELAGDRALGQIEAYHAALSAAGVEVCCLGGNLGFASDKKADAHAAGQVRQWIDAASRIHCPVVKILDGPVRAGQTHAAVGLAMSQWLAPLADYACDHDVTLVVANAQGFRAAREMWTVLENVNHPAAACCWDVRAAMSIGEDPSLGIPILNNRIQHVHVSDARITPNGLQPCPLGQGNVPVRKTILRLRGIGYRQWITVAWDASAAGTQGGFDLQAALPEALKLLKQWASEGTEPPAKPAKPAAHKPVAAAAAAKP